MGRIGCYETGDLKALKLDLKEGGRLPKSNSGNLELIYGNGVITNFTDKSGTNSYYETGELADIDLEKDSVFLVLDQDGYYAAQNTQAFGTTDGSADSGSSDSSQTQKAVQKHAVRACGVIAGDPENYKTGYQNIYCDLDTLKQVLKKDLTVVRFLVSQRRKMENLIKISATVRRKLRLMIRISLMRLCPASGQWDIMQVPMQSIWRVPRSRWA